MSREHVLADWIGDEFGINDPQRHWHVAETDAGERRREYLQRPFRAKTACVCGSCNHGWMSDLEDAVKPVLRPMMRSTVNFRLLREDQRLIAVWAAKALMVLQCTLATGDRIVPQEHYSELFGNRAVPERCRVAVARRGYEAASWPYRFLQIGAEWRAEPPSGPRPKRENYNTYRAVLAVGHAVFHLIGFYDPKRSGNLIPADLPSAFVEIAPSSRSILWPPTPSVAVTNLEGLLHLGQAAVVRPHRRTTPTER